MTYQSFTKPQFHPRSQITGVMRYCCVYCGYLNYVALTPTRFRFKCKRCNHILWHGSAFHIPAGASTNKAKDLSIPVWVDKEDTEFLHDPLKFDPMPEAVMNPAPIEQRGRVHLIVVHRNVFVTDEGIIDSVYECQEPE